MQYPLEAFLRTLPDTRAGTATFEPAYAVAAATTSAVDVALIAFSKVDRAPSGLASDVVYALRLRLINGEAWEVDAAGVIDELASRLSLVAADGHVESPRPLLDIAPVRAGRAIETWLVFTTLGDRRPKSLRYRSPTESTAPGWELAWPSLGLDEQPLADV